MGKPGKAETTNYRRIDPRVSRDSHSLLDALLGIGALGPQAFMREGPSVAAFNPAQTGVMDATAAASNAFGIPAVSAAQSLPAPNYSQHGIQGYNVMPFVREQMSPMHQQIYDALFGWDSPLLPQNQSQNASTAAAPLPYSPLDWMEPGLQRYQVDERYRDAQGNPIETGFLGR